MKKKIIFIGSLLSNTVELKIFEYLMSIYDGIKIDYTVIYLFAFYDENCVEFFVFHLQRWAYYYLSSDFHAVSIK